MTTVRSQHSITTIQPSEQTSDPWADFRQIETLTLELTQSYRHSLGKYSRFFIELENGRFVTTRCNQCSATYAPPRPLCPDCVKATSWVELSGHGTLITYSIMHFGSSANEDVKSLSTPYIFAYVLLDGASTLFPHILVADPTRVQTGMRVRVAYAADTGLADVQHPIHLMHFVPQEDNVS